MKGKIIYVIILLAVAWTFISSFKNTKDDIFNEIKEKVVFVEDDKVHSENEGKLVLVNGKLTSDNTFKFDDINLKFNTCRIEVEVQKLEDGNWVNKDTIKESVDATLGEFIVPKKLIDKASSSVYYKGNIKGYTYDEEKSSYYVSDDGKTQIKFTYIKLDDNYAILAKQTGSTFVEYNLNSSKVPIYEIYHNKVSSVNELEKYFERKKNSSRVFTGIILAITLFAGYGVFFKKNN